MWILISEPSFVSTFGKRDKPISWNKMWLGEKMIITSLESRFYFVSDKETFFAPTNLQIPMNESVDWLEWSRYLSVKILFANITFDKQWWGPIQWKYTISVSELFVVRIFELVTRCALLLSFLYACHGMSFTQISPDNNSAFWATNNWKDNLL